MSSLDSRRRDRQSISTRDTSALASKRVHRGIKEWKLSEWWPVQLLAWDGLRGSEVLEDKFEENT